MADVLVRHIDDETKRRLAVRAASNGRSMQAELLHILTQAANEWVAPDGADAHKQASPPGDGLVAPEGKRPATAFGILHAHADASKISLERHAWTKAAARKHLSSPDGAESDGQR